MIDYFNESLSSDDEEEEMYDFTDNNNPINEVSSREENKDEYERNVTETILPVSTKCENCDKKTLDKLFDYFDEPFSNEDEEEEKENVNTCCGQDISKIESQQEIEQNTEDVNISAIIHDFQPTEDITRKETMLTEKNTANANDESFVTFKHEPAEQKKEKSDDEEKPEITLDGINYNLSESEFSFRIGKKQDKKCDAEVEVGENYESDYKKKLKNRLILNRKIKVNKLYLYPQVGNTTWNSYDKVLSKFCKNSPKEIEVSIPKGGSFQISGFKVMNNKKKNNGANVTKTCIDGKKITFICK